MIAQQRCITCIRNTQTQRAEQIADLERRKLFLRAINKILEDYGKTESAPALSARADQAYSSCCGSSEDYSFIKESYNRLLLSLERELEEKIMHSRQPIRECIKYVCAANYIDFSAVKNVNTETLRQLFERAEKEELSEKEYAAFVSDLSNAKTLLYIVDNCGEIVLDKLLIRIIKKAYPELAVNVLLRGEDVINDATLADAEQTGMAAEAKCFSNGNSAPGTVIAWLSDETKKLITSADMIIAKGQGNFESLYGEGLNPYYMFLCKCEMYVERFGLTQFSSVFTKEEHIRDLRLNG